MRGLGRREGGRHRQGASVHDRSAPGRPGSPVVHRDRSPGTRQDIVVAHPRSIKRMGIGERDRLRRRGGRKRRRIHGPGKGLSPPIAGVPVVPESYYRTLPRRRRRRRPDRGTRDAVRLLPYLEIVRKPVAKPSHRVTRGRLVASRNRRPGTPVRGARELPAHLVGNGSVLVLVIGIRQPAPSQTHAETLRRSPKSRTSTIFILGIILGERLRRGKEQSRRQNHDQQKRVRREAGKSRARSRIKLGGGIMWATRVFGIVCFHGDSAPAGTLRLPPRPYREDRPSAANQTLRPAPRKPPESVFARHPENRLPHPAKTASALREPEHTATSYEHMIIIRKASAFQPRSAGADFGPAGFSRPFSRKAA